MDFKAKHWLENQKIVESLKRQKRRVEVYVGMMELVYCPEILKEY